MAVQKQLISPHVSMNSPLHPFDLPLHRQQLVRIRPDAWSALMQSRGGTAREPLLRDWAKRGWPLIVRRPTDNGAAGLSLGLPLPSSAGKRRVAVQLNLSDIASVSELPTLSDVAAAAPDEWHPWLGELAALADRYSVKIGIFGSLAWQSLTGLNYLAKTSDIDMTMTLPRRDQIELFLAELADIDSRAPMRLDGELLQKNGAGVNWRELYEGHAEVALKTATDVVLCRRNVFLGACG